MTLKVTQGHQNYLYSRDAQHTSRPQISLYFVVLEKDKDKLNLKLNGTLIE